MLVPFVATEVRKAKARVRKVKALRAPGMTRRAKGRAT